MKLFFLGGANASDTKNFSLLQSSMREIGSVVGAEHHEIVVCIPYEGSIDLEVLRGVAGPDAATRVEMHFPGTIANTEKVRGVADALGIGIDKFPHAADAAVDEKAQRYGWLLSQLSALDAAHVIIAAGGNPTGSSNMLLHLAEARRSPILPFGHLGGAAARCLERQRYMLEDKLGSELVAWLQAPSPASRVTEALAKLTTPSQAVGRSGDATSNFFISYARSSAPNADVVETLLRRRGHQAFRDDQAFDPSADLPQEIDRAIRTSDVFVALWSADYACSPWCYDEMALALELRKAGALSIWLLLTDDTRIVPPGARTIIGQPCRSREQLQATMLKLLEA